jgi:hypothetical protein
VPVEVFCWPGDFDVGLAYVPPFPFDAPLAAPPFDVKKLYMVRLEMNASGGNSTPLKIKTSISMNWSFLCSVRMTNPCFYTAYYFL